MDVWITTFYWIPEVPYYLGFSTKPRDLGRGGAVGSAKVRLPLKGLASWLACRHLQEAAFALLGSPRPLMSPLTGPCHRAALVGLAAVHAVQRQAVALHSSRRLGQHLGPSLVLPLYAR